MSIITRIVLGLLFTSAAVLAQTSQINGVIKDSSGLSIPGAEIKATQTANGAVRNTTSGAGRPRREQARSRLPASAPEWAAGSLERHLGARWRAGQPQKDIVAGHFPSPSLHSPPMIGFFHLPIVFGETSGD